MKLDNKTFEIGTLRHRRRRELGRISNFKWLEAALNLVEIKNPFGSVHTNRQADAWWVPLFIFFEKKVFLELPIEASHFSLYILHLKYFFATLFFVGLLSDPLYLLICRSLVGKFFQSQTRRRPFTNGRRLYSQPVT